MQSVAAGIVDERVRRHLVVSDAGRASAKGAGEDMLMSIIGYSLLDLGLPPSGSVWKIGFQFGGRTGEAPGTHALTQGLPF